MGHPRTTSTVQASTTARQRQAALQLADSWVDILSNNLSLPTDPHRQPRCRAPGSPTPGSLRRATRSSDRPGQRAKPGSTVSRPYRHWRAPPTQSPRPCYSLAIRQQRQRAGPTSAHGGQVGLTDPSHRRAAGHGDIGLGGRQSTVWHSTTASSWDIRSKRPPRASSGNSILSNERSWPTPMAHRGRTAAPRLQSHSGAPSPTSQPTRSSVHQRLIRMDASSSQNQPTRRPTSPTRSPCRWVSRHPAPWPAIREPRRSSRQASPPLRPTRQRATIPTV